MDGESIRLRPIQRDDLPHLRRWAADPSIMRYWGNPNPIISKGQFESDLEVRFARFETSGYFIIEDPDQTPIGRVEFERLSDRERSAEVMILIGEEHAREKRYGTDAIVTLLRYLFHQRDLHRVWLTVIAWNTAAIRSYNKVGFVHEGTLRQDLYFDGAAHDQLVMSILRPEFDASWAQVPSKQAS